MHTIPNPADRNHDADLMVLARAVIKERLNWCDEVLNSHVADSPDLLMLYVSKTLGAEYNVQWSLVTDAEAADVATQSKKWSDYCDSLFSSVTDYVLGKLV